MIINEKGYRMTSYVAPEILKSCRSKLPPFSKETDIYSLGVLFWEISSGYPPFQNHDKDELVFNIINGLREVIIEDTPYDYYDLYTACWNGNPKERPIIEDVYDKLKCMLLKDNEIIEDKVDIEDTEGNLLC